MNVHRNLSCEFLEIDYKDDLEIEFLKTETPYKNERQYQIN
jgi:hypothetical protein